jgi:hypothetical protein
MHRWLLAAAVAAALIVGGLRAPLAGQAGDAPAPSAILVSTFSSALPVLAEHRYRLAAKIRPLLFFWMGRDNVGGARIVWRRGVDGTRGWEVLIGSDPRRAPAHVNRWGYIREEGTDADLTMLGVMKQSNEQSLDEARAHVEKVPQAGYVFKLIRTRVIEGQSNAQVTTGGFPHDYTYHDLPALLGGFQSPSVTTGSPKQVRLARSAKPGFLVAVADLIHDSTYAFHRSGAAGLTRRTVAYAYNGQLFDLTLLAPRVLKNARFGDRAYPVLLKADFDVQDRAGGAKEQFSLVFGTDGAIEEVPVYIAYQPRWWFKAELLLDETQRF